MRLAIGTAVVIIAAVTAILVITSLGKPTTNSNSGNKPRNPARSASPTPTAPPGKWGYIGTRTTDPTPLGLRELFPIQFVRDGIYVHATVTQEGRACRAALVGAALQAAVRQAGCTQVLRASYISQAEKAMATIGVFNLANSTVASTAAQHIGRSAFVAPLAAKRGRTSRLGQGTGLEEAVVKGHYLVLVWAEQTNLTAPSTNAQRQHLTGFMDTLIGATVNTALSYRMVDGKPAPPA